MGRFWTIGEIDYDVHATTVLVLTGMNYGMGGVDAVH